MPLMLARAPVSCRPWAACRARAAGDTPVVLYNIPGRTAVNMGPDLLAELAQIDGIVAVKQANSAELQPIDGLAILAGNDDIYAACLDMGGAGGICVASHIVGPEMRRMYDEPEARAEIDASLRDVYETLFITASPTPVKAAMNMLGQTACISSSRDMIRLGFSRR